ncbi:hypothetical protein DFJ63DRAFT_291982 [Scheffersomyces coipomensis]|uniref:uncharacterized protein n=1 Tax=Scheffersomyces coipomensis TaxID=1788519 RepID=UPI00315C79D5
MGVNSLWDILGPTARPVRLDALSRKKLAVDASIWIYQFLKAVRDSEGNSLPQSHIVGFFRRICKLLYFGIHPVFVFDGGAPPLKRETINKRKERRRGNAESTRQTAQKLLAIHVQRLAENGASPQKASNGNTAKVDDDDDDDDDVIYLEDLPMNHPQSITNSQNANINNSPDLPKSFRKKDEFHLPDIKEFRVSKDDNRIMPEEEYMQSALEAYDYDHVDGIDINDVDPSSAEFEQLPLPTQYMILSHLRVKSRLRLGYNKEQLEDIFQDSMDFSKFQIKQVQKRNFYTQKLMNVAGMGDDGNATRRIASDKDRRYALVKNDNGWTLSLQEDESTADNPIYIDEKGNEFKPTKEETSKPIKTDIVSKPIPEVVEIDSDSEFEEIPLESHVDDETQEEKDLEMALIKSIYDQYDNQQMDDGFDQKDIMSAIENSKKDYLDLKNKEELLENQAKEIVSFKPETNSKNGKDEGFSLFPEEFSFGESILFSENASEKTPLKKIATANDEISIEKATPPIRNIIAQDQTSNTKNNEETTSVVSNVIIDEDTQKDEIRQMPSWFANNSSNVLNAHKESAVEHKESQNGSSKAKEDEQAGLISWSEAKDILQEESTGEETEDSDLEEVTFLPEVTKKDVIVEEYISESEESQPERQPEILDYDFEEEDENNLLAQMITEENDHQDFRSQIKKTHDIPISTINTSITDEQLLQEKLQKAKRDSDEVSQAMITDVQELLRRFGIPYITAPMEAEAQCAELLKLGLVDGIITDDSDCFLFGGDRIYKNMFNQKQYVECYIQDDIDAKLGLNQDNLIEFALLLGSDYTEGIKGIGPVLAMEIMAEFGSMKRFKKWYDDKTTSLKAPNVKSMTTLEKSLLTRIRNGKLFLPESFPDPIIFQAYKAPEVDHDRTEFKWGVPNLHQIRSFLMFSVGWSQSEVDEVMIPLIRDMNKKQAEGTQSTIGEFFPQEYIQSRKELNIGKRMKTAAGKLNKRKKLSS